MATIKKECFSCDWYNPRHTDSNMPKCDKLRKLTDPYNPICNYNNN